MRKRQTKEEREERARQNHTTRLRLLIGGRIVAVGSQIIDGKVWPGLTIDLADGTQVDLSMSRDSEGNGPGDYIIETSTIQRPSIAGFRVECWNAGTVARNLTEAAAKRFASNYKGVGLTRVIAPDGEIVARYES